MDPEEAEGETRGTRETVMKHSVAASRNSPMQLIRLANPLAGLRHRFGEHILMDKTTS